MILNAFVLGTSGSMPLPRRNLSSILLRRGADEILFDCGEGLQIGLRLASVSWKKIKVVCISHSHADHVTGLPGLVMLSSQVNRDEPLIIICPAVVRDFLESTRATLGMYVNFKIEYVILDELEKKPVIYHNKEKEYVIKAFQGVHSRKVWGFSFEEYDRPGKFDIEKATALKIPKGPYWAQLQQGNTITVEGKVYRPEEVLGPSRRGRKIVYITDTRPAQVFLEKMHDADMVFIEGMFKKEHAETAKEKFHLTGVEAAEMLLKSGGVDRAGLIHFSPRYTQAEIEMIEKEAQQVFPKLTCCRDRQSFKIDNKN